MAFEHYGSFLLPSLFQRLDNPTMLGLRAWLPVEVLPGGEQIAGARLVQVVDRREQAAHAAGRDKSAVEAAVRLFEDDCVVAAAAAVVVIGVLAFLQFSDGC